MHVIDGIDRVVGRAIEALAALLLAAETILLFTGVVARYVFHRPIVWSDELAASVFLWLSMFGAVIALRRGEHMCFGALADRSGPKVRNALQSLVLLAVIAFLCLVLPPAL